MPFRQRLLVALGSAWKQATPKSKAPSDFILYTSDDSQRLSHLQPGISRQASWIEHQ